MTTLKNTTGSKAVNITTDATDHVCNEDAIVYETFDKQHFFENGKGVRNTSLTLKHL